MPKVSGVTIPQFECVFQGSGWAVTCTIQADDLAARPPGSKHYIVCIADSNFQQRTITGAIGICTTLDPSRQEFFDSVITFIGRSEKLSTLWGAKISLLPSQLTVASDAILTESEWTHAMMNQRLRLATGELSPRVIGITTEGNDFHC